MSDLPYSPLENDKTSIFSGSLLFQKIVTLSSAVEVEFVGACEVKVIEDIVEWAYVYEIFGISDEEKIWIRSFCSVRALSDLIIEI